MYAFHYLSILTPEKMEISTGEPNDKAADIMTCPRYHCGYAIKWAFGYE